MSNYPPEKNKNKFLITERSCNYILRPVQARKENYPYSYVVENLGQLVNVTVNRPWTYANHLLLDFIGHELHEKLYQTIVNYRTHWKNEGSLSLLNSIDLLKKHERADLTPELEPYADWFVKYINAKTEEDGLTSRGEYGDKLDYIRNQIDQLRQEIDSSLLEKFDNIYKIRSNGRGGYPVKINLRNFSERYKMFFSENRRIEYITGANQTHFRCEVYF